MPNRPHLDNASLIDLVARCQADERAAWEELFECYTERIRRAIAGTLKKHQYKDPDKDQDNTVGNIFVTTYEKAKEGIQGLIEPPTVGGWLCQIARNCTHDYLDSLNTRKRKYKLHLVRQTRSLSDPISKENDTPLEETIPALGPSKIFGTALTEALGQITQLPERDKWAFRLRIIAYNPFKPRQIKQLAKFLGQPPETVRVQINTLMEGLTRRVIKSEAMLSLAAQLQFEMEQLQSRLNDLSAGFKDSLNQKELAEKIAAKKASIQKKEATGEKIIAPSNAQVAKIMGMPAEHAQYTSVIVHRIREKLKKTGGFSHISPMSKERRRGRTKPTGTQHETNG